MDGACSRYGAGEVHTGFWWRELRERDHLENVRVDGRIILKWTSSTWTGWTGLGQDRERGRLL